MYYLPKDCSAQTEELLLPKAEVGAALGDDGGDVHVEPEQVQDLPEPLICHNLPGVKIELQTPTEHHTVLEFKQ